MLSEAIQGEVSGECSIVSAKTKAKKNSFCSSYSMLFPANIYLIVFLLCNGDRVTAFSWNFYILPSWMSVCLCVRVCVCACLCVFVLEKNKLSPITSALLKAEFMMALMEREAIRQDKIVLLLYFCH